MRRIPTPVLLIGVLLLAISAAACATDDPAADTTADGTSESAGDDALVLYSGRDENFVQPVIDSFEEETGIQVDVRYAGTGELATTLLTEGDSSPADVFWAQDPAFIGAVANEGLLAPLAQETLDRVEPRFRDGDGRWVGISGRSRVFVYNTDAVTEDELPAQVWDLTEEQWSGRVGIAPTNGSFVAFVTGMALLDGGERTADWLSAMAANDPQIFDGNGAIVDAVIAGDIDGGLVNHYYLLQRQADQGSVPAANHYFGDGDPGALVMAAGAGVVASSDRPDDAALLIEHLLSEPAQRHFLSLFEYPLIDGIGTPEGQPPIEDLPVVDLDLTDTADTLDLALQSIADAGLS